MTSDNTEQEPVTFVDKRKIDPETGQVREAEPVTESLAGAAAAPQPGSVDEGEVQEQAAAPERDELAERTADLQRLQAEYANYRRRVQRDKQVDIESAKASVVGELIGVLDDLDRARSHGDLDSGPLKAVADKLTGALTSLGLSEFGAEGDPFDPSLHEAVQHEGDGHDPVLGTVMRKGYKFGDRVLRHAMVAVIDRVEGDENTSDEAAQPAESEQE
ncbi:MULTISPECIES: nucleotide exchange factor GrpE [Rhodococcus]|uniref:Protein GrpE n=1 Tax=Rhodococcus oxybenzonivorans TaxID=1990687 RepID=A0AAE4UZV0_9NOCA|nr:MULTISPECIES: nucleotide exchange factor GrpE [Rhodococcus]MDV7243775.1 nucleotide exchange factor GrpE [Rhodococcus oxybenzonivorans]MDV7265364.1 nucleotide exchange factor GrpE [Rhodococcus oxybenzonivorans]MDV7274983.1 nucleotide exchange factor GrpE [Rhodococcus oxybenzonivorans]MDV7335222.1 nucleotide exchange factor GrpE [Rhodococcus oxybenzonivorans]MDV7345932.1 nucleotide exchange factor GrpE [Rhodococcus oxybenzonivorans]